jgi:hypothetical protein
MLRLLAGCVLLAILTTACSSAQPSPTAPTAPASRTSGPAGAAATSARSAPAIARCAKPAPDTPAAFAAALGALPSAQWGAADLSVSVPMPDGRIVWLYGDTLTGPDPAHLSGLVHSSAVVQDAGCFHVSARGAQLLPNDNPARISWPSGAVALDNTHLLVATGQQKLTGACGLCFRQVGLRGAIVTLAPNGDLRFSHWLANWPTLKGNIVWGTGFARRGSTIVMYGISGTGLLRTLYVATATAAGAARGVWSLGRRPVAGAIGPAGGSAYTDPDGWHYVTKSGRAIVRRDAPAPRGPYTREVIGTVPAPASGQVRYMASAHPEAKVSGGGLLVTVCSNWVDGKAHRLSSYRPVYLGLTRARG